MIFNTYSLQYFGSVQFHRSPYSAFYPWILPFLRRLLPSASHCLIWGVIIVAVRQVHWYYRSVHWAATEIVIAPTSLLNVWTTIASFLISVHLIVCYSPHQMICFHSWKTLFDWFSSCCGEFQLCLLLSPPLSLCSTFVFSSAWSIFGRFKSGLKHRRPSSLALTR